MSTVQAYRFSHSPHVRFVAEFSTGGAITSDDFNEFVKALSARSGLGVISVRQSAEQFYGPQNDSIKSLID